MTLAAHRAEGLLGKTKSVRDTPLFNDQKLKLGVFSSNCSGGVIVSDAPTGFRMTWDQQRGHGGPLPDPFPGPAPLRPAS